MTEQVFIELADRVLAELPCELCWLSDLSFLPDRVVESDLEGFLEYALCNYLGNLAHKHLE